jgi:hypothetical protein
MSAVFRQAQVVVHAGLVAARGGHGVALRQQAREQLPFGAPEPAVPGGLALQVPDADTAAQPVHQLAVPGAVVERRRGGGGFRHRREHRDGVEETVQGPGLDPHDEGLHCAADGDELQIRGRRGEAGRGVERPEVAAVVVEVIDAGGDAAVLAVPDHAARGIAFDGIDGVADAVLVVHDQLPETGLGGRADEGILLGPGIQRPGRSGLADPEGHAAGREPVVDRQIERRRRFVARRRLGRRQHQ